MPLLGLVLLAACDKTAAPQAHAAPPPPAVTVATVALRDVTPWDELSGRIEARQQVELRPRVSGYVTSINYREGAEVPRDAVLFTIDARPYRAALTRATADVTRSRARAELTRREVARTDKLLAAGAIPRAESDTASSTAAQAEAELQAAQAAVQLARLDVEFTQVRAPIAGRTGHASVSVGDYVTGGPAPTLLTTIVSVDPVYVTFTADEQAYLRFASQAEHATVSIGLADETGYPHEGKVDFVDNNVDPATGTIRVRAVIPNPDKRLTPGLYARVKLPEGKPLQAVLIDDKAVLTDQDRKFVYVLGTGDTVERRDVKLGRIVEGQRVITDGLKPGDRVIVTGVQKVFPGGKATVAPTAPALTKAVP
jgi:membrane fusion protein, multidrug efflux system